MKPASLKLSIYQGATFRQRLRWLGANGTTPVDLTGCTARMQMRAKVESPTVLFELTTENSGIVLGGTAGTIDLFVSDEDTASFTWKGAVFDLEIAQPGGDVTRLAGGSVSVYPEVTR